MKRLLVSALVVLSLAACGDDQPTAAPSHSPSPTATPTAAATTAAPSPTATGSKECVDLAAVVRPARLAGPAPTDEVAEDVADAVHAKLSRLSPKVNEPAVDLHGHLHDYGDALKRKRTERANQMLERAREDAKAIAKACAMP